MLPHQAIQASQLAQLLVALQRQQASSSNKSPRSSQRVSSPSRKRQCSGVANDDLGSRSAAEHDEDTEEGHIARKGSDSGRVDLQAVAAGL